MTPKTNLSVGQKLHGFEITQITPLPSLRATAIRAIHAKSGAQFLHVLADDTENCFSITFPTPPPNDTGIPHIMEHSVLAGSRKFPVREPFFEMVKNSMATFINAMTSQAYTVYPICSNVKKDFFNLAEVYCDAVFHPELKEDTLRREGHHLTLEDNNNLDSPLKVTGIVYNEMKGAYSTPESLVYELAGRGLFPDTPLGRDSGGDPDRIPDLTYDFFKKFHAEFYHPSNALIFTYGDIPTEEHFKFLAPVLDEFSVEDVKKVKEVERLKGENGGTGVSPVDQSKIQNPKSKISLPRQPRWSAPRRQTHEYPIGKTEDEKARTFLVLSWLVGDMLNPDFVTEWEVLDKILLGNEAAPLKKALIDSKLGADVFFAGAGGGAYELTFHVGIKGSEVDRAEAFEKLVLDTLQKIAATPFEKSRVDAAFQQLAYETLEVSTLFPMRVLHGTNSAWPYGGDPLTYLRGSELLDACRARYAKDPQLFNRLITDGLLKNPHRLFVILRPDREAQAKADAAFAAKMAEKKKQFSRDEIARIAKAAAELEAAQGKPNPPELLAKLPQLKVADLPAKPRHIPTHTAPVAGINVLRNDVFANGVNYFELDINLEGLPPELYAWLPRYNEAVNKMGAAGQSFTQIAERRAAFTGGVGCYAQIFRHATDPSRSLRRIRFSMKTLDGQETDALKLLGDLIFAVDPRDKARLRDVITQTCAAHRTALINDGAGTARRQASRGLSPEAALDHLFISPDTLRVIEDLTANFDQRADSIINNVERVRDFLLTKTVAAGFTPAEKTSNAGVKPAATRWTVSFTGSDKVFKTLCSTLEEWSARMKNAVADADAPAPFTPFTSPPREGLAGPMKVAHCIKAMPAPHLAHPDVPLFRLGLYLSRFDYFLPEIRFKGNAYGAGIGHDDGQCLIVFNSFRDPHVVETLRVFDGYREWLNAQNWTQTDIDRAIIGSAKEAERPIRPAEATSSALVRHIRGDTNELREQRYSTMLGATPKSVKQTLLRVLESGEPKAAVCVVSSREKLEEANKTLGDRALKLADILS
jgi:Zn-dependent M16 (insulinase) family peptidase